MIRKTLAEHDSQRERLLQPIEGSGAFNKGTLDNKVGVINGEWVYIDKSGRYLPLKVGQPIKGSDSRYYFINGNRAQVTEPGEVVININGDFIFIQPDQCEQIGLIGERYYLVCIDGRYKEIPLGEVTNGFADKSYSIDEHGIHSHPMGSSSPIKHAINMLKHTPDNAREVLKTFFDSDLIKVLTGTKRHPVTETEYPIDSHNLSDLNSYHKCITSVVN